MKNSAIALMLVGSLLSGCVAYDVSDRHHGSHGGDRDRDGVSDRSDRDRDGDGVSNRHDNRPNNPRHN